jgi:NAD(P)-dependent dehydrogenase (short-subunit alcohol dehydrogenase family)
LTESTIASIHFNKAPAKGWPKPPGFEIASYRASKTGMNMMVRNWERVLREDGVKVFCISPGFLATGLNGSESDQLRKMGAEEPSVGGDFVRDVIDGKRDGYEGKAIRKDKVQEW